MEPGRHGTWPFQSQGLAGNTGEASKNLGSRLVWLGEVQFLYSFFFFFFGRFRASLAANGGSQARGPV